MADHCDHGTPPTRTPRVTVTLSGATNATIGTGPAVDRQNLSADPDDGMVTLSWSPPLTIGNAEITGYEYQYEDSDAFADTWTEVLGGAGASEVGGKPHERDFAPVPRAVNG